MRSERRHRLRRMLRGIGLIANPFAYRRPPEPTRAGLGIDAEAIAGDWQRVGDDLRRSMVRVASDEGRPGFDAWLREIDADTGGQCLRCAFHESTEWTCTCDRDCGHPLCAERGNDGGT